MNRPSTLRDGVLYRGIIRDDRGQVVWTCPHLHRNRDMSPGLRQSARDCAAAELRRQIANRPELPNPSHPEGSPR